MSSNDPYGPYPGPSGPGQPGQPGPGQPGPGQPPGGVPSGPPSPYGYPQQPPRQPLPPSGYTFGPFAPQGQPSGPGPYGPPPGYGPPPPAGPPPKRSNTKVALIAGAVALVVLGGGTGIVLASQAGGTSPDPTATTRSVPGQSASSGVPLPPTSSASDAVTGYLQALASNDADAALAYSAEPLAGGGTLSRKVLAASNRRAKLTGIDVPTVTDANATAVDATYKLGSRTVTETFAVVLVGTDWKLKQVVAEVSLAADREPGVPMKINGATVKSDTVSLFPGSYVVTSGLKTLSYGSHNTLLVKRPTDLPTSRLKVTLTSAGKKVGRAAAKKSYESCLQAKSTQPKGCPFGLSAGSFKINKSTVKWQQRGSDPFEKAKFLLLGRVVGVKIKMDVVMNADCTISGRPATCTGDVKQPRVGYVIVTKPKKSVVWRAS